MSTVELALLAASREASAYFDRVDKSTLYHAAAHQNLDWLLSDIPLHLPLEPEGGLVTDMLPPDSAGNYTLLFPKSEAASQKQIRLQEIHQITRELVEGIYIFNQIPSISIDTNQDSTSTVSVSSAYTDTLVGEALFAVDYYIKSLLHGTMVPQKDKRGRMLEEWKKFTMVNLREEFMAHGMIPMEKDKELGKKLYKETKQPRTRYPPKCVNSAQAHHQLSPRLTTGEDFEQQQAYMRRDIFLQHLDQVRLGLVFRQESIQQRGNLFLIKPVAEVVTGITAMQLEAASPSSSLSAHLHGYLQKQRQFVEENLRKKVDISRYIDLLGFVSFMTHLLVTLKKQNKIISVSSLIKPRSKDVMRTERELHPFIPLSTSRWSPCLSKSSHTGAHGGINFLKSRITRTDPNIPEDELEKVLKLASVEAAIKSFSSFSAIEREISTCEIEGKSYYIICLEVETFYPKTPKLPRWVHAMSAELRLQCSRLPQLNDLRIQDMLRRPVGPRKSIAMKTVNVLLQASIQHNLLPAVMALLRRVTQTRLEKADEKGMTLLHYAATNAHSDVISALMIAGSSVHQNISPPANPNSLTKPIHLAAKTGSVEAICCLIHYGADLCEHDEEGWTAIHHAAFHNCHVIIRHIATVAPLLVSDITENRLSTSPILLAAQNGCLDSFKCLDELGADLAATTTTGVSVVHYAALRNDIGILKYLVVREERREGGGGGGGGGGTVEVKGEEGGGDGGVDVWATLSEMLTSEPAHAEASARSLDSLTRWRPGHSDQLLQHRAIDSLVQLLKKDETMQLLASQVLANLSNIDNVKAALIKTEAVGLLVKLLGSTNDRIQVNVCLVLSDLAVLRDTQDTIAAARAIPSLIKLLQSDVDDLQLFSCACLGILAHENPKNQTSISEANALPMMVSLLRSPLTCIQECAASATREILERNKSNQLSALFERIIPPLVVLLRSKDTSIHSNAARTIEALASDCMECQQELLADSTCINLLKRLLKMRDSQVKVCGGCALWAIAGILISNKRLIATHMGLELLVDMLTIHNEKLDFVCSEALGALATELGDNQNRIIHVGGVKPLVEVLTIPTSQRVCLSVIHTLSALCMKPALVPNAGAQTAIGSSRGVVVLSSIVSTKNSSEIVRVEAACTLAKLLLGNPGNEKILARHTNFSFLTIFHFFASPDPLVRLLAGYCLSIMAFDNPAKIKEIKDFGMLNISNFVSFLQSKDQFYQAHAGFQIVALSKLITGIRNVDAAVQGVKLLVSLLSSEVEQTKVLSAEFIASLSRTVGGLPGALVMAAVLDPLMVNLSHGNGPVIESTCVCLGYLTFHPMASRMIVGIFRDNPELFDLFKENFPMIVYSPKFLTNWKYITRSGIPVLR